MEDVSSGTQERSWIEGWTIDKAKVMRALFLAYYHPLWVSALRITGDQDLAEDVVQDVMARIWEMPSLDHVRSNLGGYLHRSVVNTALNRVRERRRWVFGDDELSGLEASRSEPDRPAGMERSLESAIMALPERCRIVFVFSRFEGMANQEIADLMGISVKTVENQMTKAFRLLRASWPVPDG